MASHRQLLLLSRTLRHPIDHRHAPFQGGQPAAGQAQRVQAGRPSGW